MSKPAIWDTGQPLLDGARYKHINVNVIPPKGLVVESVARKAALKGALVDPPSGLKHADQEDEASSRKTHPSCPEDPFDLEIWNVLPELRLPDWFCEHHHYVLTTVVPFVASLAFMPVLRLWITHPLSIVMNIAILVAFGRKLVTIRRSRELVEAPPFPSRSLRQRCDTGLTAILGRVVYEPVSSPQFQRPAHQRGYRTMVITSCPPHPYSPSHEPPLMSQRPRSGLHRATLDYRKIAEPNDIDSTKSNNSTESIMLKEKNQDRVGYSSRFQTNAIHATSESCSITVVDIPNNCDDFFLSPCLMVPADKSDATPPSSANNFDTLVPPGIPPGITSGTERQPIVSLPIADAVLPEYPTLEANPKSFKNKGLAFLSACQTATGDTNLPDEAVHLASGMLMAGYPSVIATMWSVMDGKVEALGCSIQEFGTDNLDKICSAGPQSLPLAIEATRLAGTDSFPEPISSSHVLELLKVAPLTAMIAHPLRLSQPVIFVLSVCRAGNMLQPPYPTDSKVMRRTYEFTSVDVTKYLQAPSQDALKHFSGNSSYLPDKLEWEESCESLERIYILRSPSWLSAIGVTSDVHFPWGYGKSLQIELGTLLRGHEITFCQLCYKPRRHLWSTAPGDEPRPGSASPTILERSETTKVVNIPSDILYKIEHHSPSPLLTTTGQLYEERPMNVVSETETETEELGLAPVSRDGDKKAPSIWRYPNTLMVIPQDVVGLPLLRRHRQPLCRPSRPKPSKPKSSASLLYSRPFYRIPLELKSARSRSAGFGWEPGGSGDGLDPSDFLGLGGVPGNLGSTDGDAFWRDQNLGLELLQGVNNDPLHVFFDTIEPAPNIPALQPQYHGGGDSAVQQPADAPPTPVPLLANPQPNAPGPAWNAGFVAGWLSARGSGGSISQPQESVLEWNAGFVAGCMLASRTSRGTQSGVSGSQTDPTGSSTQIATPPMSIPSTSNNNARPPRSVTGLSNPIVPPFPLDTPQGLAARSVEYEHDNRPGSSTQTATYNEISNASPSHAATMPQELVLDLTHVSNSSKAKRTRRGNDKRYECDKCDKAFHRRYIFNDHMRQHRGEPSPYICDIPGCNRPFSNRANLRRHQKDQKAHVPTT
ncbi:unnamed protein product [Rhizoctonia solani]|uniref:C2H2-type domain-containing protein n=1 Tax=Rhizoctonia solani TaxID=456999 RepID=A0A8H3H6Z7_9AGAM|nr:unnamed protein product [Rhizoctonia solani]